MDSATRSRLHDVTLQARQLLVSEVQQVLEGVYGLHRSGSFEPASNLPAVQALPEVRRTRERLEKYLADERAAGLKADEAHNKLTKEVAFTWLNRLVAFKMMEARRLVRGTLDRYHDSNAFKFYLSDHPDDLALFNAGDAPQDALGEGPRDVAYRHFLLDQCSHMAGQIKVLFDPDNLPSSLFPRPRTLRDLIALLNDPPLAEAWQPGSEEAVGWVYQYFNELEKAEVFARLNKGGKVSAADIPAATQLFTPRWIVRALVHNSLGRLWMQMHPNSRLAETLDYLVPGEDLPRASLKPVRDITMLDPACGTMHFGLVAFDLFAEMYREEIERAGEPGWPVVPSVNSDDDIPAAVVANNLYGIDIDLRAVQLSALTLLLKARSLNPRCTLTDSNLACADVLLLNGARLEAFIEQSGFTRPIYERLVRGLWAQMKDANQLGSLVKLEAALSKLIEGEQVKFRQEQARPHLPGFSEEQFETEAGEQEFWDIIAEQVAQAFDEFARRRAAGGGDESYFAGEATKGLRVLRQMLRQYDIVATNPPYMSDRSLSPTMGEYLKKVYPEGKGDLYAAFIERCADLLAPGGRLAMITQQSFMFISSYEKLRARLRERVAVETMVHVGPRAFAEIGGEKVNTTVFVLRREPNARLRDSSTGTYFRLVKEPDAEAKRTSFERAIARMLGGESDRAVYRYRQGDFDAIPGAPWVYWITPGLRELFENFTKLEVLSQPRVGLQTGDNTRFLRYWWEVGLNSVGRTCPDAKAAVGSGKRWFPYMKGGEFRRWWGNQDHAINWSKDGLELWAFTPTAVIRNANFYFRSGITWTDLTSGRFNARLSPGGFIFDVAGSSAFPPDPFLLLALMNSPFAQYALKLINPTVHVQVGDLARLPIPTTSSPALNALVEEAIALARTDSEEDETTYDFIAPPDWHTGYAAVAARKARLAEVEGQIDEEVYRLYDISAEDRAAIEGEVNSGQWPVASEEGGKGEASEAGAEDGEATESLDAANPLLTASRQPLAARWISYAVGVVLGRFEPGVEGALGRGTFSPEVAARLRALEDADGLVVLDPGHPDDLTVKVERVLEAVYGYRGAEEIVLAAAGGKALADYLKGDFFKRHVQQYRKRPIYWLLQSPKKGYSLYAFHEKLTRDRLFLIDGSQYLGGKLNGVRTAVEELRGSLAGAEGKERKGIERELEGREALLLDLEAFARNLSASTSALNERNQQVGWQPEIDDGVLLNLAPLYTLMPSWSAEPKKAWEALQRGDYDWSHTAMRYWPTRVLNACRPNKSFAIAHNRLDVYAGGK